MKTNAKSIQQFIKAVDSMKEAAIGCDDAFDLLDQYVELVLTGEPAHELFPQVAEHLAHCKACHEEFEALKHAVASLSED
jgi:predicted anti-sigma-YlaC factor YlaD